MQLVLILVFRFCCHVVGLIEGKINLTDLETLQHCLDRASESHKRLIDMLAFFGRQFEDEKRIISDAGIVVQSRIARAKARD